MKKLLTSIVLTLMALNAFAEPVVVVGKESSLNQLDSQEVTNIFLARTSLYPSGEKAIPLELKNESLRNIFYKTITGKSVRQLNAYWTALIFTGKGKPPKSYSDVEQLIAQLTEHSGAIAYIDSSLLTADLKVVYRLGE